MLIGYARVSKSDGSQVLDLQVDELIKQGVNPKHIYHDHASSRKDSRPGLEACLKALQSGNTLVVWKLDRLGRDMKDLICMIDDLNKQGINFKVLAGSGAEIDTTTANGRLVFGIFAALAEYERELIRERTVAGLAAARARGRKGGRPAKMDKATLAIAMAALKDQRSVSTEIANKLGMTTTTLYKYVNGDGSLKEMGDKLMAK
jgi:DNA invertase Pin-like site-specific DNA recombinase